MIVPLYLYAVYSRLNNDKLSAVQDNSRINWYITKLNQFKITIFGVRVERLQSCITIL